MLCKDLANQLVGFFIIFTDLQFSSSLIILLISSALQSYRKILLGFEPGMKYVIIFVRRYRFVHIWCKRNKIFVKFISNDTTFN